MKILRSLLFVLVSVWFCAGCATPSYALFYERYAGTCQVSAPPAAAAANAAPQPVQDAFIKALNEHDTELRRCYVDALRYGETHGKIRLRVEVRPDGRVEPVTLLSDKTSFPPLACCVVANVRELRLRPASASAAVSFEYSFAFHTVRTATLVDLGVPLSSSGANRQGYLAELDEASVVIGGLLMYPLAPDHLHYYTDVEEGDESKGQGTPR